MLSRGGLVGENQSVVPLDASAWDGIVTVLQAHEHCGLLRSGHQPKDAAGTVEDGIGQGHSPALLIEPRDRDITVRDVNDRISGHERGRMPIGSQAKMHEVEYGWGPSDLPESPGVSGGRGLQIIFFDRHGVDLVEWHRSVR